MVIGVNVSKNSALEWFIHVLSWDLNKQVGVDVFVESLKTPLHTYVSTTLNLKKCPTLCGSRYIPEYKATVENYSSFVLSSVHTVVPNLFYTRIQQHSGITILLDVVTYEDMLYVKNNGGYLLNISDTYRHGFSDIDIDFNGLHYVDISNSLTQYIKNNLYDSTKSNDLRRRGRA